MLQAHNPNYLKASSPKNGTSEEGSKDAYDNLDNIDEIPIAELSLDVPLQVHCESLLASLFFMRDKSFLHSQKTI